MPPSGSRPGVRVSAGQDNTGVLSGLVARGELEIAPGFCPAPHPPVRGVRLVRVRPRVTFPIALLRSGPLSPAARTFATLAHRLCAGSR